MTLDAAGDGYGRGEGSVVLVLAGKWADMKPRGQQLPLALIQVHPLCGALLLHF